MSLLKERTQQFYNLVEQFDSSYGFGETEIQVSEHSTSCTFEILLLSESARLPAGHPEPAGTQWGAACWLQHPPTTLRI